MIPETATKSKAERHLGATLLRREGNRIALTAVGRDSLRQFLRLGIARRQARRQRNHPGMQSGAHPAALLTGEEKT